jgi:hypothetical protein
MNDCLNTCNKIYVRDLTLTFISSSHLGQKLVKTAKFFFFSRTVSATGEQKKTVLKSIKGNFSSFFEATSCDLYFADYNSESAKV